ncbi:secretion protein HlyD [Pleurocapsa sp. CCALA 161]|uniref:HlyD family efflux transporter periplasmic adaptor subunit n=1 Tax=Pleurocapsa sp. CCALA 161 TaxID=2107688 RepID=UPI000D058514|nr:HlyD family efflux transporter periplasmic adaptor subunit [Pleurocapsa sp. CCALA 161]PSB08211.1 secretion protein HlyD [Pleurocapsa sp. CCALA 161]
MKILPKVKLAKFLSGNSHQETKNVSNHTPENNSQLLRNTPESEESQLAIVKTEQQSSAITVASSHSQAELVQWSPAMQSLLEEPPSNLPLQLIAGGVVFCLTFFAWAWFGQIDQIGKAQGKLVPKGEAYKIESLEAAKISTIEVKEGEKVKAGQLIATLDSGQETKEVERLKEILASSQVELRQKLNLLEQVKIEVETQRRIGQAEIRSQQLAIESAISKAQITSDLLAQQQSELAANIARQGQTAQLPGLDKAKFNQISAELKEHQQRLAKLKELAEQGAISQEYIFQAQQAQRQIEQQLIDSKLQGISSINEQVYQSQQSTRNMRSSITENQGALAEAQKEAERLQTELESKKADSLRLEVTAKQKAQQLELEINQARSKIAETKNLLASAQSQLEKKSLKAPVAGTVLAFNVVNTGKVIQPGETVAEIAPNQSPLVLSAILPDRDAGFIKKGMTAQVKFDAYSYQDYGIIPGKVISISANSQTDEKLGEVYRVRIELERNYVTDNLKKISFKPGQTASADIVIRHRRIIDVLLDPVKKMQQDGVNL